MLRHIAEGAGTSAWGQRRHSTATTTAAAAAADWVYASGRACRSQADDGKWGPHPAERCIVGLHLQQCCRRGRAGLEGSEEAGKAT